MEPMPRLTLGSRKKMGFSCAWQSVMCSSDTLPKGLMSYSPACAVAASAWAWRPRAMPAAEAEASTWRNSRLLRFMGVLQECQGGMRRPATSHAAIGQAGLGARRVMRGGLLCVDRRLRVEQQGHQVAHLVFVQQLLVAEARHLRAGVGGACVPQLAPGVLDHRLGGGA